MNFSFLQPSSTPELRWHIFLEVLEQGQTTAWVAEFPECKVTAESQEAAIADLQSLLGQRMAKIKVLPLQLSAENSWLKLGGILKDDPSFVNWSDRFWAEKQQNVEDDQVLSVEESLRVM